MEEIVVENSNSGLITVRCGDKYLHSKYNPENEINKFLKDKDFSGIGICVLLCPGLPYLQNQIEKKFPNRLCLTIHSDKFFYDYALNHGADSKYHWWEGLSYTINDFLEAHITDITATFTELFTWPPSMDVFYFFTEKLAIQIKDALKAMQSNFLTAAYFGKKWLKNTVFNVNLFKKVYKPFFHLDVPIFIAGSGPGLNDCIEVLKNNRNKFYLLALPSSIKCLVYNSIQPDIIVSSDAGYWAEKHLECIPTSWFENNKTLVYAPFNANLKTIKKSNIPIIHFHSNLAYEKKISKYFNDDNMLTIPECGTVAAIAFELILKIGFKTVYSAGLDFSNKDIITHVQPHTFQINAKAKENKLNPYHSMLTKSFFENLYFRKLKWNQSNSLNIYSNWFFLRSFSKYIKTCNYNPSDIENGLENYTLLDFINVINECSVQYDIVTTNRVSKEKSNFNSPNIVGLIDGFLTSDSELKNEIFSLISPFDYRKYVFHIILRNFDVAEKLHGEMIEATSKFFAQVKTIKLEQSLQL